MDIHTRLKLETALIDYDTRQAKTKHYNRYAYAQYLEALQEAIAVHETGISLERALAEHFEGRLLVALQKAIRPIH